MSDESRLSKEERERRRKCWHSCCGARRMVDSGDPCQVCAESVDTLYDECDELERERDDAIGALRTVYLDACSKLMWAFVPDAFEAEPAEHVRRAFQAMLERAEKAERERDEARRIAETWRPIVVDAWGLEKASLPWEEDDGPPFLAKRDPDGPWMATKRLKPYHVHPPGSVVWIGTEDNDE